jgi:hypothetical protein
LQPLHKVFFVIQRMISGLDDNVLNGLIQELWAQANSWRLNERDPRGQQRIVTLIQVLEGSGQG